jgi:L-rhamnonate dehydratase
MKIARIEAFPIQGLTIRSGWKEGGDNGLARRAPWQVGAEVANPMSRYPRYRALRDSWRGKFDAVGVLVTADDGSWGFGTTVFGPATTGLINDHLGPLLAGENPMAIDRLFDMMMRISSPYSPAGLASYAISAIDLALWDLKGRVLNMPVYELAGGPARERQYCYSTGNDTDWHMELGFTATKLACPYGAADGLDGLRRNEDLVAKTRDLIGPDVELMLDCWMAFDVEFAVRLAERLRPYGLKWIEDCLIPEDMPSHQALRERLPWMTLTGGEHWYTPYAFFQGARDVPLPWPKMVWPGNVIGLTNPAGTTNVLFPKM